MAKQFLGKKKHKLCEEIADKKYLNCLTRGGREHFLAECWYSKYNADWVNYKTREVEPYIREGKIVK